MTQKLLINAAQMGFARNSSLFDGLTENEKDLLLEDGEIYSYPRKKPLFLQGDPVKSFYLVCRGTVQLLRATSNGKEITTGICIPGNTICEKEIFEPRGTHNVNAMAIDNVEALELPIETIRKNIQKYGSFSRNLIVAISQTANLTEIEAEHQATMTAAQLTACYLQHLCVFHGLNPRNFKLPYKKSLIASRLGMGLETLSRTLPKLKDHGIKVEGTNVTFYDFQAVDRHTCGHCSVNEFCSVYKKLRESEQALENSCHE